jgi:multiple sugar transport system substrate-binding protein
MQQNRPAKLRGIGWNHTRGISPLIATAQRFEDLYEHFEISWDKRSLKEFGDASIDELARKYDLLVIDHPYIGHLSSHCVVHPLETLLASDLLADLRVNSVGQSFQSYWFENHLWAVPVDAAAPVSSWRPDLLDRYDLHVPTTWEEVMELAHSGLVAVPATPVDSLMNFFMLCCGLGEDPFNTPGCVVSQDTGIRALQLLRELMTCCSPDCLYRNPIQIYREMTNENRIAYCPFAFGYSNYSRAGYAPSLLRFGALVRHNGRVMRSTLGGAGLAVSAHCPNLQQAIEYSSFIASSPCQRTLYAESGGQPAHRCAWQDPDVNRLCGGFFESTIGVLDAAFLRPRHDGYVEFQEYAGKIVHSYLQTGSTAEKTISALNEGLSRSERTDNNGCEV